MELAHDGPVLELAIGTGRIALPLAARGLRVDGVDLSEAMVAKLRAKPGGKDLAITLGDFAEVPVEGRYRLIFIVFNTLFNLLTQADQVRCFKNVSTHLMEDGRFVIEAFVPTFLTGLRDDQYVDAETIGVHEVALDVGRHDPVNQTLDETAHRALPKWRPSFPNRHALCMAKRTRLDGRASWTATSGALGRLGPRAIHLDQPESHLGLRPMT